MFSNILHYTAWLAQSVEHETLNLGVVGSSPTLGEVFVFLKKCYFQMRACLKFPKIKSNLKDPTEQSG